MTLIGLVACCTTEKTEIVVEMPLAFLWGQFSICAQLALQMELFSLARVTRVTGGPPGVWAPEVPEFKPEFACRLSDDLSDLAVPGGLEDLELSEVSFLLLLGIGAFMESREISCCRAQ